MKKIVYSAMAALLMAGAAYAEEKKSMMAGAEAFAANSKEKLQQASTKAKALSTKAKDALAKADDIMGNLESLSIEDLKTKVAALDKEQLMAYAKKYQSLFKEHEDKIAAAGTQLKELGWFKRWSADGKELKAKAAGYAEQLTKLKEQYSVYTDQLKALGVDLSAYGL